MIDQQQQQHQQRLLLPPSLEQAQSPRGSREGQLLLHFNPIRIHQLLPPTSLQLSLQPQPQPPPNQLRSKNPSSDPPTSKRNTLDSSPTVEAAPPVLLPSQPLTETVSHPPPPLKTSSTLLPPTATLLPLPLPPPPLPTSQPHPLSQPSENPSAPEEVQQLGWGDTCLGSRVEMEEGWEEAEEGRRTMSRA